MNRLMANSALIGLLFTVSLFIAHYIPSHYGNVLKIAGIFLLTLAWFSCKNKKLPINAEYWEVADYSMFRLLIVIGSALLVVGVAA